MNRVSELTAIIGKQLAWHKSRIDCFAQMLLALFTVKTVSLSELAVAMDSQSEIASRNKRLYRFFAHFTFDFTIITRWVFSLFFSGSDKAYISIDRTNWFWGRAPINIFMSSVCYEGIAIPLLWHVMKQDGATTAKQQIDLCERFISLFGAHRIAGLLGDREFTNERFIGLLVKSKIPLYLRIKKNIHVRIKGKKFKKAGEWRADKKAIPFKLIRRQKRPQYTFFRYGLDIIRDAITGFKHKTKLLKQCLMCLGITQIKMVS